MLYFASILLFVYWKLIFIYLIFQPNHRNLLSGAVSSLTDNDGTIDPKNFATIRTTSIVQRQQKEHLQVNSEMVSFLKSFLPLKCIFPNYFPQSSNNEDIKVQNILFISPSCDLKKVSMYFSVWINTHAQDEIIALGNFFC